MLQQSMNSSEIMTLDKMGSRYPSRLSFSRSMLRTLLKENWTEPILINFSAITVYFGMILFFLILFGFDLSNIFNK